MERRIGFFVEVRKKAYVFFPLHCIERAGEQFCIYLRVECKLARTFNSIERALSLTLSARKWMPLRGVRAIDNSLPVTLLCASSARHSSIRFHSDVSRLLDRWNAHAIASSHVLSLSYSSLAPLCAPKRRSVGNNVNAIGSLPPG